MYIIEQILNGNKRHINNFFNHHYKYTLSAVRTKINNDDLVHQITQDVIFKFINIIDRYKHLDIKRINTLLYRSAINKSIDYLRLKKRYFDLEDNYFVISYDKEFDLIDIDDYNLKLIEKSLSKLSDKNQKVFKARIYDNLKFKDISKKYNINETTCKSIYRRVIKLIQKDLKIK